MSNLSSSGQIDKQADQLLRKASALRKFPTAVEDIIAAQRLSVSDPDDSPLAPGMIARAPAALRAKLGAAVFKVLAVLDRRERVVHVHPETNNTNHERFNKLHEVGHDLCPWQDLSHAIDGRSQLDPGTNLLFEQEANYAGARLLFQGEVFNEVARSYETGMAGVLLLAQQFGSSIHAAFHQYVSTHLDGVAGYILRRSPTVDPLTGNLHFPIKLALSSTKFAMIYMQPELLKDGLSSVNHHDLKGAWYRLSSGEDIGTGEIRIQKRDGTTEIANFELFSNSYNLFMLINPTRKHLLARSVRLASIVEDSRG